MWGGQNSYKKAVLTIDISTESDFETYETPYLAAVAGRCRDDVLPIASHLANRL